MKSSDLINYINRLTELWLEWMNNHRLSNDISKTYSERRQAGELCETLQYERQDILRSIDDIVERDWNNE